MSTLPVKVAAPEESVEQRFRRLATVWDEQTAYLSSMEAASKHPAYQEIIGLGSGVVPFLLRDLEQTHNHWFIALGKLTGANPVPESAAGNVPRMVDAWLRWAKDQGCEW